MTKKEWYNLRVGSRVQMIHNKIVKEGEKYVMVPTLTFGTVTRFNFNCSQCTVKWDDNPKDHWHGRLSIDCVKE